MTLKVGLRNVPFECLSKTKIGIDGAWFIRKYSLKSKTSQPLTEGVNEAVLKNVRALVRTMESCQCKIVWIWNGLPVRTGGQLKDIHFSLRRETLLRDAAARERPEQPPAAPRSQNKTVGYEEMKQVVNRYLVTAGVEVINAPYLAVGQAMYMAKQKYIQMFFGTTDYFLFGDARCLITDFQFKEAEDKDEHRRVVAQMFAIELSDIAKLLGMGGERLADCLLLMGCELCPTAPFLDPNTFVFECAASSYKRLVEKKTALEYLKSCPEPEMGEYLKWFLLAKACLEYHPVIGENGNLLFLNNIDIPGDLSVIFGERLPDQVYFDFSKGRCSAEYLKGLAYSEVHTICSAPMFELAVPLINSLYKSHITFFHTDLGGVGEQYQSAADQLTLKTIAGADLICADQLSVSVQWLILMLAKKNEALLEHVFVFNRVCTTLLANEPINWAVLEFAESAKFAVTLIKDLLKLDREADNGLTIFDPINGWRMAEVLHDAREKKLAPHHRDRLADNAGFMTSLMELFSRNSLSPKIAGSIKYLLSSIETG